MNSGRFRGNINAGEVTERPKVQHWKDKKANPLETQHSLVFANPGMTAAIPQVRR
jgi:hypothetical protein